MHILFVTSEVAGIFKIGGLADVSLALPLALEREDIHVTVALPFYKSISSKDVKGVGQLAVDYAGKREIVFLFSKKLGSSGGTLLLFRHPRLDEYHADPITETFAFYSKVIATYYLYGVHLSKYPVDVVHCHDWHTALVPLLIGERNKLRSEVETIQSRSVRTIITIHNLMYQGVANEDVISNLDAPRELFHMRTVEKHAPTFSFLREGFEYADRITTVSPTYAREIINSFHHDAIGAVLQQRSDRVVGILNGIDQDVWDPATDPSLPVLYTRESVISTKPIIKKALQKEVGLPIADVPVFGFVGRIEPRQKGIDIVIEAIDALLEHQSFQVVILGTGESESEKKLSLVAKKHKANIAFINEFDEARARRIYAGSDCLLVPSKFEPCGLTQMIAMRYGTIPVVRATGGLADSVKDGVTGFVFDAYSAIALQEAMVRAGNVREKDRTRWNTMMHDAMREDFSWNRSAADYKELYRTLLK